MSDKGDAEMGRRKGMKMNSVRDMQLFRVYPRTSRWVVGFLKLEMQL